MSSKAPRPLPLLGEEDHARFWANVIIHPGDACWGWRGKLNPQGYAMFSVGRRWLRASRVAWTIVNGPLAPGDLVLHDCDNPNCPRPSHLFTGSQADNVADMIRKGRRRASGAGFRGERNPRASLSAETARAVKGLLDAGVGQSEVVRRLGIGRGAVQGIARGLTWKHLFEPERERL